MNGYKSLHPLTEQVLRNLGIKSADVSQGWGSAKASAGYHAPVGTCDGRKYSTCFDLRGHLIGKDTMYRLWESGCVAFARIHGNGWTGDSHIHAVHLGITDDDGHAHILSGPRAQVVDFLKDPPRSGLVGHALMQGIIPPASLQAELRQQYAAWLPDYPCRVLAPGGQQINCYAWLEGGQVTVETDSFCRWWGKDAGWFGETIGYGHITERGGKWTSDGRFVRATVRQLAELMGLRVASYRFDKAKRYATVQIGYHEWPTLPIAIHDRLDKLSDIVTCISTCVAENPVAGVVIDHAQEIQVPGTSSKHDAMNQVAYQLKGLSETLNVPILTLSQTKLKDGNFTP